MEVVTALELGADEYVRLPCHLAELMIRIWALLRRSYRGDFNVEPSITIGDLTINPQAYEAFLRERRIELIPFRLDVTIYGKDSIGDRWEPWQGNE